MEAYWYFDFASPFAYLQLAKTREWRARMPLTPVPVLARALQREAEVIPPPVAAGVGESAEGFVRWRAKTAGVPLTFPQTYPFNSIAALRLCAVAGSQWPAIESIFAHLWRDGRPGATLEELKPVALELGVHSLTSTGGTFDAAATLRANTDAARALGVTGVPTIRAGGILFEGSDAATQFDEWLAQPLRRTA
jgi:2-hydroxychromene-2-carboxylate isomerase